MAIHDANNHYHHVAHSNTMHEATYNERWIWILCFETFAVFWFATSWILNKFDFNILAWMLLFLVWMAKNAEVIKYESQNFFRISKPHSYRHLLNVCTNHRPICMNRKLSITEKWLHSILHCICLTVAIQCEWLLPLQMHTPYIFGMSNARGNHTDIRQKITHTNHTHTSYFWCTQTHTHTNAD